MKRKEKRPVPEWKRGILDHHQRRPGRADRSEFPRAVVAELIEETDNQCQAGCGRLADQTHHVMPRGRGGRGVKTNGMRICWVCHERVQTDEAELQHWIDEWERRHGPYFWFDDQDREEHERKRATEATREAERQQHEAHLKTITHLLATAASRALKRKETTLLCRLKPDDLKTLTGLIYDTVKGAMNNGIPNSNDHSGDGIN